MRLTATGPNNEMSMLQRFFFGIIRTFWLGILSRVRATEASNPLTADGAVPLNFECHRITTVGAALAGTLAAGTDGQHIKFVMEADGGFDYVLTPIVLGNYGGAPVTIITFNDIGDSAELVYLNGVWYVVGTATATVA
jgi:hypothetical protein